MKKKAIIIDPYLDTLGGGERYALEFALALLRLGWQPEVWGFGPTWRQAAADKLGIQLKNILFEERDFLALSLSAKRRLMKSYGLSFFVSDGSLPFLFARRNFIHFQVPFQHVGGRSFVNRLKLNDIEAVICNSEFTKRFIDREFRVKSVVLYPPVAVDQFLPAKKETVILSVGRFTDLLHHKRQDVLVKAFRSLRRFPEAKNWRLVLAGSDREGKELVGKLRQQAAGLPVEIKTNLSFSELQAEYAKASLFWTATGFGVEEEVKPEAMEHFGITTVEAMAAGCVPVVINKGGQKEIVHAEENGFCWSTTEELVEYSRRLITDAPLRKKLSRQAVVDSRLYSEEVFYDKVKELVD